MINYSTKISGIVNNNENKVFKQRHLLCKICGSDQLIEKKTQAGLISLKMNLHRKKKKKVNLKRQFNLGKEGTRKNKINGIAF